MKIEDVEVWLINLPRDVARREEMEKQLTTMGLAWQLFSAINGKARQAELMSRADEAAYHRNMGTSLVAGKLGVYASHLTVWEAFVASGQEIALILEDDVVFHDNFLEALATALAGRDHWDLVRFNAVRAKLPVVQGTMGRYQLNAYIGPFTGNACYLIKRDVAARLLPGLWPQTRALDHELNRFYVHDYRQRGLEPFASHTDDHNISTVIGTNFAKEHKFKWYRRLPYYQLKAVNYFRRILYLARTGAIPRRRTPLLLHKN